MKKNKFKKLHTSGFDSNLPKVKKVLIFIDNYSELSSLHWKSKHVKLFVMSVDCTGTKWT